MNRNRKLLAQIDLFGAKDTPVVKLITDSAQKRKGNGQFLASEKAGSQWWQAAMHLLDGYIKKLKSQGYTQFTFEEFRLYCATKDLADPASLNAWGCVPQKACKAGYCEWSGEVQSAIRAESHRRLIKVWKIL